MTKMADVRRIGVVGAGIVGLATARALQQRLPGVDVTVIEKESGVGRHQTSRNSGVVHAGIYYPPGSLKARLCVEGGGLLRRYCERKGLEYEPCGKLIVALDRQECARLRGLYDRAIANGVADVALLPSAALREIEPNVIGELALHSPRTAIVDFGTIATALADDLVADGGTLLLSTSVEQLDTESRGVRVCTDRGVAEVDVLVNCAGLHADRVARLAGDASDPRIVPFRGEYHQLRPDRRGLVRGLIYPVPDPRYPFLGIHLTKRIDGEVLLGPNAVMALAREGYRWSSISPSDVIDAARWPGAWRMARAHWRTGVLEVGRSLSVRRFVSRGPAVRTSPRGHGRRSRPEGRPGAGART
jgi:(S)-2-hydroxyglutarate dehydrogenase